MVVAWDGRRRRPPGRGDLRAPSTPPRIVLHGLSPRRRRVGGGRRPEGQRERGRQIEREGPEIHDDRHPLVVIVPARIK